MVDESTPVTRWAEVVPPHPSSLRIAGQVDDVLVGRTAPNATHHAEHRRSANLTFAAIIGVHGKVLSESVALDAYGKLLDGAGDVEF